MNVRKIISGGVVALVLLFPAQVLFVPQQAHAADATTCRAPAGDYSLLLVRCRYGNAIPGTNECECGFRDVVAEIKQLINFAFLLAMPLTVIAITWAGIQILLARGNPGKINEAKKLATQVLTGFIIVLTAWLIVYTITSNLMRPEFYTPFLGDQNSNSAIR